jgi:hypothetical protein
MGKHRKWGFDKPEGPRGPISTSQHRIPWEEARQRHLRLPGMSPQISGHRNLLSPNEVPPMPEGWQQSQSNLSNTSNPLPLNWLPNNVPGLTGPSTTSSTEESTAPVPIEENGDYTVVNPIQKVKQGRKNTTLEPKRWFFLVRIYNEGKKAMAEIELDDLSTATVPVASLEGNVALR